MSASENWRGQRAVKARFAAVRRKVCFAPQAYCVQCPVLEQRLVDLLGHIELAADHRRSVVNLVRLSERLAYHGFTDEALASAESSSVRG